MVCFSCCDNAAVKCMLLAVTDDVARRRIAKYTVSQYFMFKVGCYHI